MNAFEELKNKNFKNKQQIDLELSRIWGLKKASKDEKKNWKYKINLEISPSVLIGLNAFNQNKNFIINEILLNKFGRLEIISNQGEKFSPTGTFVEMVNPIINQNVIFELHPTKGGKNFWEKGYLLDEKYYKAIYYTTKEYRSKYEKSLNEIYGSTDAKAPIHIQSLKNKISNTIKNKYGVEWFLQRGTHYNKISEEMIVKYGVENVFYSDEWQEKMNSLKKIEYAKEINVRKREEKSKIIKEKNKKKKLEKRKSRSLMTGKGISTFEISVIKDLLQEFKFENPKYYSIQTDQAIIVDLEKKRYYKLDFYDDFYNIVLEINGDFWHCNPAIYANDYYNKKNKSFASEIWQKDSERIERIKLLTGAKVLVIWESDWNNNKQIIKEKIKELLNQNNETRENSQN